MAGSKAALLVATAAYGDQAFRQLRAPGHDVEALRRVLADPAIGGFDVRALVNQPGQLVEEETRAFSPTASLMICWCCTCPAMA
jgi:hypothetical protein